ncbi:MAG: sugar ABC transporter permease [Anaerolineaceae bacterium]|jgi:arabinogalactan oligomer/maltooligosaccharide transport system permease protein|nr:MAG: sugar ABC transporter permease [Anaerolineaceae bacterium]
MFNFDAIIKSLSEVGATMLAVLLIVVILETLLYFLLVKWLKVKNALVYMLISPAILGLLVLQVYPLVWEGYISMTNMSLSHFFNFEFIGLKNYVRVFTEPVLKQVTFFPLFWRTILWTFINILFHVSGGMILALLLNREMKLRGFYRMIIIIPWALPQVVAAMAWRGEFNYEYGWINIVLKQIGLQPVQWLTSPVPNFAAMCIVNIWLGIPFMTVIFLGGLQSISGEYYEAAEMDGASNWQKFWKITLPLMKPIISPAVILGTVWTFNTFNISYFINQFELESSDILVTALFRAAFQYNRYGFSAAFAFVIFFILLGYSALFAKTTGALKGVRD